MNRLTNDSYVIRLGTRNFTECYFRDGKGWVKVSARRRFFRLTAEQVLNHLLPALAGIKRGVTVTVEHRETDDSSDGSPGHPPQEDMDSDPRCRPQPPRRVRGVRRSQDPEP